LWLDIPNYPEQFRLDRIGPQLNPATRRKIAYEAIKIAFDIFSEGYAHRDFHAKNLFWIKDQLAVIDFEELECYPNSTRPPFPRSFDLTGEGLPDSGFGGNKMSYIADTPSKMSLQHVLGVSLKDAIADFESGLKNELKQASRTFATAKNGSVRHVCREETIYSSFSLPFFTVSREEAQRDSDRRLEAFGIIERNLRDRRLLDLGCHIGGMLFAAQRYEPLYSLGIEHDPDKVAIASKVAAYSGLKRMEFKQGDIDQCESWTDKYKFDVVFCFAIEAHVKCPECLYRFLGEVTTDVLYFEGNATSEPEGIRKMLLRNGFRTVQLVGASDDDRCSGHTPRPMFVARK
jgi:hypothetical protein